MKITILPLPGAVPVSETPPEENQEILKTLDTLKKKADPTFQGAFHEKKWMIKARQEGKKIVIRKSKTSKKRDKY